MEPTRHLTYYENTHTQVQDEHDSIEARAFHVCENSSEDERHIQEAKHKRKTAQHITSYGSIKKPTRKQPIECL